MAHDTMHAIVVSGCIGEDLEEAHRKALEFFGGDPEHGWDGKMVSPVVKGISNGYRSFFVGPDGSGEGYSTSREGDRRRAAYLDWLQRRRWEPGEGSLNLDYVEVLYGDDDGLVEATRSSEDMPDDGW